MSQRIILWHNKWYYGEGKRRVKWRNAYGRQEEKPTGRTAEYGNAE